MPILLTSVSTTLFGTLVVLLTSQTVRQIISITPTSPPVILYHALFVDAIFAVLIAFLILCHIEHRWIAKNQSFPYTFHLAWNFSSRAFNFQVLTFEIFHLSWVNRLTHVVNMTCEQLLWLFIIHGTFGVYGLLLVNVLLTAQICSYEDPVLVACVLSINTIFSALTWATLEFLVDTPYLLVDITKIVLFWLVVIRTASHAFEPLPPTYNQEIQQFESGFGEIAHGLLWTNPIRAIWLFVLGIVSELGAGMPGRYFNVVAYKATHWCGYRSEVLLGIDEAQRQAGMIIGKGWAADETTRNMYLWALPAVEKV